MNLSEREDLPMEAIRTLLRARPRVDLETDCPHLMTVALSISKGASESVRRSASDHLDTCETCREAVRLFHGAESVGSDMDGGGPIAAAEPRGRDAPVRTLHWKVSAIAAAAMVLAVLSVLLFPSRRTSETEPGPEQQLLLKGEEDRFFVAIGRGAARFTAEPFERLVTGDRLGMFYSARRAGHLMVVNLDSAGNLSLLYPAGQETSAEMRPGTRISLPDGAIVREGTGCEWIVAVFSEDPLLVSDVNESVRQAERRDSPCTLDPTIAKARTLRVLPFTR